MKRMKKIAGLLLALVMVLSLATTAFADDNNPAGTSNYTITVNKGSSSSISINGMTYTAYKLFDVTYSGTAYSYTVTTAFENFEYIKDENNKYKGETLVTHLATLQDNAAELDKFAAAAYKYITDNSTAITADGTATASTETATIDVKSAGYYLVYGEAKPTSTSDNTAKIVAACALTTAAPTATITVKADAPSIDKVINTNDKFTTLNVGDTVNFKVTSKVPDMTGYNTYKFMVTDTMTEGLTFDNTSVKVKIGNSELATTDYALDTNPTSTTNPKPTFTLTIADLTTYSKDAVIEITYSATLNEKALNRDKENNKATLTYSNDPYSEDSTTTTPETTVDIYDFDIVIDKYEKDNTSKKLEGAEFVLYKLVDKPAASTNDAEGPINTAGSVAGDDFFNSETQNNDMGVMPAAETGSTDTTNKVKKYYKQDQTTKTVTWVEDINEATKLTTGKDGNATFQGLAAGTYYLEETKAPDGYNKLKDPKKIEITATAAANGTVTISNNAVSTSNGQYQVTEGIENATGSLLPSTGGIGTTLFYVVGGILMVGAAVLLITKRRMNAAC